MARASRSTRPKIRMQSDSSIAVSSPPLAESGSGTSFNGGTGKCLFLTEESRYGVVVQVRQVELFDQEPPLRPLSQLEASRHFLDVASTLPGQEGIRRRLQPTARKGYNARSYAKPLETFNPCGRADRCFAGDQHCSTAGAVSGHADIFTGCCPNSLPELRDLSSAGRDCAHVASHLSASPPLRAVDPRAR